MRKICWFLELQLYRYVQNYVEVDYSDIKSDIKSTIRRTLHTVSYSIHTQTKSLRFFLSVFISELADTVNCKYFAHKNAI